MAAEIKIKYKTYPNNTNVFIYQDNESVGHWCSILHTADDAIVYENEDGIIDNKSISIWAKNIAEDICDEFGLCNKLKQEIIYKFESILDKFRTD